MLLLCAVHTCSVFSVLQPNLESALSFGQSECIRMLRKTRWEGLDWSGLSWCRGGVWEWSEETSSAGVHGLELVAAGLLVLASPHIRSWNMTLRFWELLQPVFKMANRSSVAHLQKVCILLDSRGSPNICRLLQCYSMHTYLGVHTIEYNGTYFWTNMIGCSCASNHRQLKIEYSNGQLLCPSPVEGARATNLGWGLVIIISAVFNFKLCLCIWDLVCDTLVSCHYFQSLTCFRHIFRHFF